MIKLTADIIDRNDIDELIEWLKKYPRLTKGENTVEFEKEWSAYIGCDYSIYVNSGSSANLLMAYAYKLLNRKKRKIKIIIPDLAWSTSLAPFMQFDYDITLCDIDLYTLNINVEKIESIIQKERPDAILMVNVLGFTTDAIRLREICKRYHMDILEDSCETIGTIHNNIKAGNFGQMSTFSFFWGHHISTIEGGMICTNNGEIRDLLLMLRSHGWDRDLFGEKKQVLRNKFNLDEFKALYSFYVPAFNVRSTDLQAFIGLGQIKKLDIVCGKRQDNFNIYQSNIKNIFWKINPRYNDFVSNFAYPIIHFKKNKIIAALDENNIENRPLVCGSLSKQPFAKYVKKEKLKNSLIVDKFGFYVPNHHGLTEESIIKVCDVVNQAILS